MTAQRFGRIDTPAGPAEAMLCMDADRPREAMLHLWGAGIRPAAMLCALHGTEGGDADASAIELRVGPAHPCRADGVLLLDASGESAPEGMGGEPSWMADAEIDLIREGGLWRGRWRTPGGAGGGVEFSSCAPGGQPVEPEHCDSWDALKAWMGRARAEHDAVLFRGHGWSGFTLSTSLHRAGRSRLERYCGDELQQFRTHAEAVLGARFDLADAEDYATLLGLAQHHGLPTPLLDWTASPYVAAFFAFADAFDAREHRPESTHVRLYALTRAFIDATSPALLPIPRVTPYVTSLAISPRHNPRLYAQQGVFVVTNLAEVEGYIRLMEQRAGRRYLVSADVPVRCAEAALEDLAFMGLTAATLFPGLDGVGRMIRHQMSFKRPLLRVGGKAI